jgi:hypothetical protein
MLQTLIFVAACLAPLGVFTWSMMTERAIRQEEHRKKRDLFERSLKG